MRQDGCAMCLLRVRVCGYGVLTWCNTAHLSWTRYRVLGAGGLVGWPPSSPIEGVLHADLNKSSQSLIQISSRTIWPGTSQRNTGCGSPAGCWLLEMDPQGARRLRENTAANVGVMLDRRRRRRPNITPTVAVYLVLAAGSCYELPL